MAPKRGPVAEVLPGKQPLPTRHKHGHLVFADHPEFTPNLTPMEVMQLGSFGVCTPPARLPTRAPTMHPPAADRSGGK